LLDVPRIRALHANPVEILKDPLIVRPDCDGCQRNSFRPMQPAGDNRRTDLTLV